MLLAAARVGDRAMKMSVFLMCMIANGYYGLEICVARLLD